APVRRGGRDRLAVDALGLFRVPLDIGGGIEDFAARLRQGLAHFGGEDGGQLVGIGDDQVVPLAQQGAAVLGGSGGPWALRLVGGIDGGGGLARAHFRQRRQFFARRGIEDIEGRGAVAADPVAVDIAGVAQEFGRFQV